MGHFQFKFTYCFHFSCNLNPTFTPTFNRIQYRVTRLDPFWNLWTSTSYKLWITLSFLIYAENNITRYLSSPHTRDGTWTHAHPHALALARALRSSSAATCCHLFSPIHLFHLRILLLLTYSPVECGILYCMWNPMLYVKSYTVFGILYSMWNSMLYARFYECLESLVL